MVCFHSATAASALQFIFIAVRKCDECRNFFSPVDPEETVEEVMKGTLDAWKGHYSKVKWFFLQPFASKKKILSVSVGPCKTIRLQLQQQEGHEPSHLPFYPSSLTG